MIRNKLISLAERVVWVWYCIVGLVSWAAGRRPNFKSLFEAYSWFEGKRLSRCRRCYSWVMSSWKACPGPEIVQLLEENSSSSTSTSNSPSITQRSQSSKSGST